MPTSIAVKSVKITVPIPSADFAWAAIPPPGTAGAKNMTIDLDLEYADGRIAVALRAVSLQKVHAAHQSAPGGFVVIQGKLAAAGSKLVEVGAVYQAPKPSE